VPVAEQFSDEEALTCRGISAPGGARGGRIPGHHRIVFSSGIGPFSLGRAQEKAGRRKLGMSLIITSLIPFAVMLYLFS
jgi:hypothetical protein